MKRNARRALSYSVFYEKAGQGGYVAFVPRLPGCRTQGDTLEEAERNVKEAITLYLESLLAHGESIPEEGPCLQGRVSVPISLPLRWCQSTLAEPLRNHCCAPLYGIAVSRLMSSSIWFEIGGLESAKRIGILPPAKRPGQD